MLFHLRVCFQCSICNNVLRMGFTHSVYCFTCLFLVWVLDFNVDLLWVCAYVCLCRMCCLRMLVWEGFVFPNQSALFSSWKLNGNCANSFLHWICLFDCCRSQTIIYLLACFVTTILVWENTGLGMCLKSVHHLFRFVSE